MRETRWVGVALALGLFAARAEAAVPKEFTVQGVLRDNMGVLQTVAVSLTVRLFSAPTGGVQYGSDYVQGNVMAVDGLFTNTFAAPNIVTDLQSASEVWLEVTADTEVFPRQKLSPQIYASICATTTDSSQLGGVAASSYLTITAGDARYLGIAAQAADSAKLGGTAAASFITTATADGRYLGIAAQAADSSALGGVAASSYQQRVSGTCTGNSFVQSVGSGGTVGCGTAPGGTVTSVTASAPLSNTGTATAPVIALTGVVPPGNGGNRWGGAFSETGPGAFVCPNPPGSPLTTCAAGNPLNSSNCACPGGFTVTLLDQLFQGNNNTSVCTYQCYQ